MALDEVGRVGIRAIPDTTRFASDLKKSLDRVEKAVKVNIRAAVELSNSSLAAVQKKIAALEATISAKISDESMRNIRDQVEGIQATATITAAADTLGAQALLATAARPRVAIIHVQTTGLEAASLALARISGARVVSNTVESVGRSLSNLDKSIPKIAAVTTAVAALLGMLLAGTSNVLALGASLASVAGAALALPGIIAGFGVGLAVMVAALKDTSTVLADLGPAFTGLQDTISANFWRRAADPIRELTYSLLPRLRETLGGVSSALGSFAAEWAGQLQKWVTPAMLSLMMEPLIESINIAKNALAPLVEAFTTLGATGAQYLPRLAQWFVDISDQFNGFLQAADSNGSLDAWIESGIEAVQALGSVIANTGSIFAGLARAAEAAGGSSLQILADGLGRVADVVNGPVFQGALTTVLEGAHAAMEGLGRALDPVGAMFVALAPTLAYILEIGGQIAGSVLGGIASALAQPVFATGLRNFFDGIQVGIEALLPVLPALANLLGQMGTVAATLGATLGPVLATAFAALAPVVQSVLAAVAPLIPILGGAFISIIEALAPGIQAVVAGLVPLVASLLSGLAPVIATLATTLLPPLLAAVAALAPIFATVLATLVPFVTTLVAELAPVLGSLITSVLPLFTEMLALLAPMFATAAATILPLVMSLVQQLAPVLLRLAAELIPVLMQAMATLAPVIMGLLVAILPLVASLVTQLAPIIIRLVNEVLPPLIGIFSTLIAAIAPLITQIATLLIPIIQALMPIIITVFGVVVDVVTSAMKVIQGIIQVVTGIISGNWSQVWTGIQTHLAGVWELIKSVVSGGIEFTRSVISGVLGTIKAVWSTAWEAIKGILAAAWDSIQSASQDKVMLLLGIFADLPGNILSKLGNLGALLTAAGQDLIGGLISGIANMAQSAVNAVTSVVGGAIEGAKSLLGIASPSKVFRLIGEQTGEGLVLGLAGKEGDVQARMSALVKPPRVQSFSANAYNTQSDNESAFPDSLILEVDGQQVRAWTRRESITATGGALGSARNRLEAGGKYAHLGGLV